MCFLNVASSCQNALSKDRFAAHSHRQRACVPTLHIFTYPRCFFLLLDLEDVVAALSVETW